MVAEVRRPDTSVFFFPFRHFSCFGLLRLFSVLWCLAFPYTDTHHDISHWQSVRIRSLFAWQPDQPRFYIYRNGWNSKKEDKKQKEEKVFSGFRLSVFTHHSLKN